MFAHLFAIRPWEVARLTVVEFDALAKAADQWVRDSEKVARSGRG